MASWMRHSSWQPHSPSRARCRRRPARPQAAMAAQISAAPPRGGALLELYAGCAAVTAAAADRGLRIAVPCEIQGGRHFDLQDRRVQSEIVRWLRCGLVWAVWLGTPCTGWSQARTTSTSPPASAECAKFTVRVLRLCARLGIHMGLENPASSQLFKLPTIQRALALIPCTAVSFHMCAFGAVWKKPTTVVTTLPGSKLLQRSCPSPALPHVSLRGSVVVPGLGSK